jgi:muramoyltetrapeptide carboxypeptidase
VHQQKKELLILKRCIGTTFDRVNEFIETFKDEGIMWYFESCEMNSTDLYRTLWQMKINGWFKNCNGVIFGRADGYSDVGDFKIEDAYKNTFDQLDIPVVYDVDLGHLPPQLVFINGVFCEITVKNGKGEVIQSVSGFKYSG